MKCLLNSQVMQGLDLTNKLVGVLMRFREEPIALIADVEAMYHQIKVQPDDVDALRSLWYPDCDLSKEPEEYCMTFYLFGGVWSASCANFALQKMVRDNNDDFDPLAVSTIARNFYVDDCLKSVETQETATTLVAQLRELLQRGGFNLTKWICNSRPVLEMIPQSDRAKEVEDLDLGSGVFPVERTLGVCGNWSLVNLFSKFKLKKSPQTRRGLLSIVTSIYDPLGFISPFVLSAKIFLQDLYRRKLNWDDAIPSECFPRVQRWLKALPSMEQFAIKHR